MKLKYITMMFIALNLMGCSSTKNVEKTEDILNAEKYVKLAAEEEIRLSEFIKDVSIKALEIQKSRKDIQNAIYLPQLDADGVREANWQYSNIPEGMSRTVAIDWKGSPEPILKTLADLTDYEISFVGKKYPQEPTLVIQGDDRYNIKYYIDEVERQANNDGYIKNIKILEDIKFIIVYYQEH